MSLPRRLSSNPVSIFFNEEACKRVDKVFVDDVHIPNCMGYDLDAGWAFSKGPDGVWTPKVYGVVRVTERQGFAKPTKA